MTKIVEFVVEVVTFVVTLVLGGVAMALAGGLMLGVVRDKFKSSYDADKWMRGFYSGEDEIEFLHVMIRTDFADGRKEY